MRKMKLLSLLLAVLMVVSCVPAALFVGASAEETQTETVAVSYKDPREGATKIYYALGGSLKATDSLVTADEDFNADNVINTGHNIWGVLCNDNIMKHDYEAGSVLVVKFKGELTGFADAKNAGVRKSHLNFLGACTIFREDNTKLPIIIEGVEADRASTIACVSDTKIQGFANDFYFTNLTFKRNYSSAATSTLTLYAGAGNVVFDNVDFDLTGNVVFAGDNYSADAFYGWTAAHIEANKDKDGLLQSSFTFGKDTAIPTSAASGVVITVVAADGHSGSGNYKGAYLASGTAFNEAAINKIEGFAAAQRFSVASDSAGIVTSASQCVVYPTNTKAAIVIDNGKANSDTADFGDVYVRRGCNAVGASDLKILSGNVNQVYLDTYTGSGTNEIYYGDINLTVDGGKVVTRVWGLRYAYLVGNYTIELKDGYIRRFDGTDSSAAAAALNGNYLFHATGGRMFEYYGGCEVVGKGHTVETRVEGGTFESAFNCLRFAVTAITNNISGGTFNNDFRGGSSGDYDGGDITNNISGHYNDTKFNKTFYAGGTNSSCTLGTVTTNFSGGSFNTISKGSAVATSNSLNVISEKATDEIKFSGADTASPRTFNFDKFEMNGGTVHFWAVKVIANNAQGKVVVRNTGEWLANNTYFTFTPAEGKTLEISTTQLDSVSSRGRVLTENGKYLVVVDIGEIEPTGASLILTQRIAVKFIFSKDDVDAVGKENFDFAVVLDGVNLTEDAELKEDGETYTLTTTGIGLPDSNTLFTLTGDDIKDSTWSLATLAEKAEDAWEGDWKAWASAFKNMIDVVIDGKDNAITPEDKDYGTRSASRDEAVVSGASAALVMNSAVGVELELNCTALPQNPVVKVNGNEIEGVYTTEGNIAIVSLYFAPWGMEKTFTVTVLDGTAEIFSLEASVAGFAEELDTDAGDALLSYVQATTVVAEK